MAHDISLSANKRFIILKVTGEIDRNYALEINKEVHRLGKSLGINRYLVDLTEAVNTDSMIDQYDFAYKDMQQSEELDKLAIVATLVSPHDHSHDFIETVARNSGLNVTLFRDREQAIAFLTQDFDEG